MKTGSTLPMVMRAEEAVRGADTTREPKAEEVRAGRARDGRRATAEEMKAMVCVYVWCVCGATVGEQME